MDLLVEPIGTGPSGLSDAERQRFVSLIPNGIAAALGLRYLSELRCVYPGLISDVNAGVAILQYELEAALFHGRMKLAYSWPFLPTDRWREVDLMLVGTMAVLAMADPRAAVNDPNSVGQAVNSVLGECEKKASSVVRTAIDEIKPLMFACDFPTCDGSHFLGQPQRYFTLLERYCDAAKQVAVIDEAGYFRYSPHPLLRWLVSLRARLKVCIERLGIGMDCEVADLIDWFVSYAIEDDGDWGILPDEYFHGNLKKVGAFIEETRINRRFFLEGETTLWERLYLNSFDHALRFHRDSVRQRQKAMDAKFASLRDTRHQSGSALPRTEQIPLAVPTPRTPGLSTPGEPLGAAVPATVEMTNRIVPKCEKCGGSLIVQRTKGKVQHRKCNRCGATGKTTKRS